MENRNLLDGDVTCPHNVSFFFWFETDKKIDLETRNDVLFLLQVEQKTIEQKKKKKKKDKDTCTKSLTEARRTHSGILGACSIGRTSTLSRKWTSTFILIQRDADNRQTKRTAFLSFVLSKVCVTSTWTYLAVFVLKKKMEWRDVLTSVE